MILHIDYETFSEAPLKEVGAWRYAFDPSTEILLAGMALDEEEPVVWAPYLLMHPEYRVALQDPAVEIWCHNAQFEMAISTALFERTFGFPCPDLSRFRCTKNLARRACIPNSLESGAEFLGLEQQKDKRGAQLIKLFSVLQPAARISKKNPAGKPPYRIYPKDRPAEFEEFRRYCAQDVRTEREIHKKLAYFAGGLNDQTYQLDSRINARGVAVNLGALRNAQRIIEEEMAIVVRKFQKLTGLNPTQRDKFLEWLKGRSVVLPDLTAETVEETIAELENNGSWLSSSGSDALDALKLKRDSAYAAVKKVSTMLDCACPDGRIHGMLVHHGATTGRWTSEKVQLQNAKRPTKGMDTEDAYREICDGISRGMLEVCYGAPLEVLSSCVRHFIDFPGGMFDADYAAIEARIVCWLAGQEDALRQFRAYDAAKTKEQRSQLDVYKLLATQIFGLRIDEILDMPHRFVGKQARLGLGFGMGAAKFRETCAKYGYDLPVGLEFKAVQVFRATNRQIVSLWEDVETAAKAAILTGGEHSARRISFTRKFIANMPFLLMRLPSGRELAYPRPEVRGGTIHFFGNIAGNNWGTETTWGGTLVENATQAVAADIMGHGAMNAELAEYEIATLIHDQALAYRKPGQSIEEFVRLLTMLPAWAAGLPIAAEGKACEFYSKG